jgi:hypothetical protein
LPTSGFDPVQSWLSNNRKAAPSDRRLPGVLKAAAILLTQSEAANDAQPFTDLHAIAARPMARAVSG